MNNEDIGKSGYIKIVGEPDRITMASLLFKNGYSVTPVRKKRNGKSYEYFIYYELKETVIMEE